MLGNWQLAMHDLMNRGRMTDASSRSTAEADRSGMGARPGC
jgi:hypothetical protein